MIRRRVKKILRKTGENTQISSSKFQKKIDKKYFNVCQEVKRRETGINRKGHPSPGLTEPEKANLFSRYLPNSVKQIVRHGAKVFCGNFSQDGSVFMSASQDCHIKLYDTTGVYLKEFQDVVALNVGWSIIDTAYSHDQRHLIYSSWSSNLYLCDIAGEAGKSQIALDMRPSTHSFCAFSIKFSQDDNEILTGSNDGCLYIYDRSKAKRTLRIIGHDDDVNSVCFCDNTSQLLFSVSDDGLCKAWDRRALNESHPRAVGMFAGHACGIACVDTKGDGRYLLTSSKDQTIKLWDMRKFSNEESVKACRRMVEKHQNWDYRWEDMPRKFKKNYKIEGDVSVMTYRGHSLLRCLSRAHFSPLETTGQRYIYTGSANGCIYIYDLHTGDIEQIISGHNNIVRDVSWHPTKPYIISSSWDSTVKCWHYSRSTREKNMTNKKLKR
ncbi:DDB1- and CUL4-associated factor 11-like isoform X2 [Xenia sp. Carnegie-2017]|uniref:DDB1- and CUL4-associated factor 11-like isoform X2 n=1 Tax=Xenia sp. Carnegie-2017 TaxID=2897299 RepID=UPI001F03CF75|nr:DDB1- and CUL4-associated factor 11-like isoform X2 [Xenia sp. Carnegie-2017]